MSDSQGGSMFGTMAGYGPSQEFLRELRPIVDAVDVRYEQLVSDAVASPHEGVDAAALRLKAQLEVGQQLAACLALTRPETGQQC